MKQTYLSFVLLLLFALVLVGCTAMEREYLPDLVIDLEDRDGQLIIREWQFLLGSGAEVYYRADGKEQFLGNCVGSDDGYTPFAHGAYEVIGQEDSVRVRWTSGSKTEEETFLLPE